jgi:signal transduction histidine kinase/ActR/RegA family two-component response regulator
MTEGNCDNRQQRNAPQEASSNRFHRWWLDRSVRSKGLTVVAVPLIALVGVALTSLALQRSESQERSVATADLTLSNSGAAVLADAVNAETGIRGYAATGDPLFLAPYTVAISLIDSERSSLRIATRPIGDARQARAVGITSNHAFVELAQLRSEISGGIPIASLRSLLERQKATMDDLRRQVADLIAGPTKGLVVQRDKIVRLQSTIGILNIAGLIVGILAGLAGIALFTTGISRRVVAAAANADRLGEAQPLDKLFRSDDELGRLEDSLIRAEDLLASRATDLTTARDEALRATQAKTTFLSHTSHELRTPLNSVLGFAQLLEMSDLSAEDSDSVRRILLGGRHLLTLINELIDIARIESGDLKLSLEPVAIVPLVQATTRLLSPLAAERSITISHRYTHPFLAAHADQQRLSQVLVNLLSNAVKYNRPAGTIVITSQLEEPDQISIVVSDTGQGMTHNDLELIFIPFERINAGRTDTEGTGIGLPLAKTLTEAMGGSLTVSSVPGEGSVFTVTFPRARDVVVIRSDDEGSTVPTLTAPSHRHTTSILYIEDNPANVEMVSRFVRSLPNTSIQSVASGRTGIEYAAREIPDIILLDLDLPDLHGSKVLHELKAEPNTCQIPVVILSADASTGASRRLLDGGALAYLTKPINLAELGQLLESTNIQEEQSHVTV